MMFMRQPGRRRSTADRSSKRVTSERPSLFGILTDNCSNCSPSPIAPACRRSRRTMDLSVSDEQRDLRETLTAFFAKESTIERVRAAEPTGFDLGLWEKVAAMGLPSMAVGEDL